MKASTLEILKSRKKIISISAGNEVPVMLINYWRKLANSDLLSVCKPLKKYGITYVLYVKRLLDGSQIELTNRFDWSEHYYQKAYYRIGPFKNIKYRYENGKFFWQGRGSDYEEMYKISRESFNIDHGFTIVLKHLTCNEFFHFAGDVNNPRLINFYINQPQVLERFILYFKDKLAKIIKKSEEKRLILSPSSMKIETEEPFSYRSDHCLQEEMPIERYYFDGKNDIYLTQREAECTRWHIIGKTAEEIGMILAISKRTVEVHLEKAKQKLNCPKQSQLAYKIGMAVDAL